MRVSIAFVTLLVAIASAGQSRQWLVPATIDNHPSVVALLRTISVATSLTACGGCILNNRSVLTAARCFEDDGPERWRIRAGSANWNSSGIVYPASSIIRHENWDEWAMAADLAIVQTASGIAFGDNVQPGTFGAFDVPVNGPVLTVGWGYTSIPLWSPTEYSELQSVELTNLDLAVCRSHYSGQGFGLSDGQLCTGFDQLVSNANIRNKCFGEPGMPVYYFGIIVGVRSYGLGCQNHAEIPSINTHFGSYMDWILSNA